MKKDKELGIVAGIHALPDDMSRRTMMQLAVAAGISLAMTPAMTKVAEAADVVRGKLGMLGLTPSIDYWALFQKAFRQVAADLQLDTAEYFNEMDMGKEVAQIRGLSAANVKMLNGYVYPDGALPVVAKLCEEQAIPFACVWDAPNWYTPPDAGDHFVNFFTPNSVNDAYEIAKILIKSIGGEGKIASVRGLVAMTEGLRYKGLEKAVAEFPGVELIEGPRADWDRKKARDATLSLLTAHPDIKGFFPLADDMAFGTISVLREKGLKNVKVASIVGLPEGLTEIAKGENFVASASALPPYQCGYTAVAVFDALNGWKPMLGERMQHYESVISTVENAAEVNQRFYGEGEKPFDWLKMSRTLNPETWDPQNRITALEPEVFWADVTEGKEKLNPVYKGAKEAGEFDKVNKLYADHYKTGPNKKA